MIVLEVLGAWVAASVLVVIAWNVAKRHWMKLEAG